MYPLKTILIGCNEESLPHVRRELMNCSAEIEGEFATAGGAIDFLRSPSPERRLLIFHLHSRDELEQLDNLTTRLPGWPVVVLADGYDPKASLGEVIVGIMRAGAAQILALPIGAKDFRAALERIALQFVYSGRDTKVVAVAGVVGGSGATTVALNLAFEMAHSRGLRCILADFSLRVGVIAAHLDLEPAHSIMDLLRDVGRVDTMLAKRVLVPAAKNLAILPGPNRFEAPVKATPEDVANIVEVLKQLADIVVLDLPCTYDDIYFETIAAAGHALLIGSQNLPSIRALKMVTEALKPGGTRHLVINRFDAKNKVMTKERLLKPLGVSTLHSVARDDQGMGAAMDTACPLRLASPRSPALADIESLAGVILGREHPPVAKPAGLISRLGRVFAHS